MSAFGALATQLTAGSLTLSNAGESRIARCALQRAAISRSNSIDSLAYRSTGTPAALTRMETALGEFSLSFQSKDGAEAELTTKMMTLRTWSSGVGWPA